jgi:hypothetical protein
MEERFPLQRGWRGVFSLWRKKGRPIGDLLEMVHPLYGYVFGIGEGIGKLLKLL